MGCVRGAHDKGRSGAHDKGRRLRSGLRARFTREVTARYAREGMQAPQRAARAPHTRSDGLPIAERVAAWPVQMPSKATQCGSSRQNVPGGTVWTSVTECVRCRGAECVPEDRGEGVADGRWPLYEVDSPFQNGQCGRTVRFNMLQSSRVRGIRVYTVGQRDKHEYVVWGAVARAKGKRRRQGQSDGGRGVYV